MRPCAGGALLWTLCMIVASGCSNGGAARSQATSTCGPPEGVTYSVGVVSELLLDLTWRVAREPHQARTQVAPTQLSRGSAVFHYSRLEDLTGRRIDTTKARVTQSATAGVLEAHEAGATVYFGGSPDGDTLVSRLILTFDRAGTFSMPDPCASRSYRDLAEIFALWRAEPGQPTPVELLRAVEERRPRALTFLREYELGKP